MKNVTMTVPVQITLELSEEKMKEVLLEAGYLYKPRGQMTEFYRYGKDKDLTTYLWWKPDGVWEGNIPAHTEVDEDVSFTFSQFMRETKMHRYYLEKVLAQMPYIVPYSIEERILHRLAFGPKSKNELLVELNDDLEQPALRLHEVSEALSDLNIRGQILLDREKDFSKWRLRK